MEEIDRKCRSTRKSSKKKSIIYILREMRHIHKRIDAVKKMSVALN